MKIAVFGGTGGTGQQFVNQALAAGHHVVAVVRDPARLAAPPAVPGRLEVVVADALDPTAITPALSGVDVVVSALGTRGGGPTSVCADGARSVLTAMRGAGLRRLLVVSASGMVVDRGDGPFMRYLVKPILGWFLRYAFDDMRAMEALVMESGLDWTVVRPPQLTDGPRTGSYRSSTAHNVPGTSISRANVADCLLRSLADDATVRTAIAISR